MEKINLEHLFFDPTISEFKANSSDDYVINSKKHKIISFQKIFLGLKETLYANDKEIFLITHKNSHELAKHLFECTTKETPLLLNYYYSEEMDWVAFLFHNDSKKQKNELISSIENEYINIVIGVSSGYDDSDIPNFFLMLKQRNINGSSYLTIDNYKFSKSKINEYINKGNNKEYLINIIDKEVANEFENKLNEFIALYSDLKKIEIEKKCFLPMCLDLYNKNRSKTSINYDNSLQITIKNLINYCNDFVIKFGNELIPCSVFIDFIIQFNFIEIEAIESDREKLEELFVQKEAYKKLNRLFETFKKSEIKFKEYLDEQVDTYEKIKHDF